MEKGGKRCFGEGKPLYAEYHDFEWGVPVHDDRRLFEMISLEGAQAGLSWETVLKKRENYRRLFHDFEPSLVAAMSDDALETILKDPGIIRNRLKIFSVRRNAQTVLKIGEKFGSFDTYLWGFVNHRPIVNEWSSMAEIPPRTPISDALSKDLKKWGMSFIGTTIIYAFMQAVGMVNDHLVRCPYRG